MIRCPTAQCKWLCGTWHCTMPCGAVRHRLCSLCRHTPPNSWLRSEWLIRLWLWNETSREDDPGVQWLTSAEYKERLPNVHGNEYLRIAGSESSQEQRGESSRERKFQGANFAPGSKWSWERRGATIPATDHISHSKTMSATAKYHIGHTENQYRPKPYRP